MRQDRNSPFRSEPADSVEWGCGVLVSRALQARASKNPAGKLSAVVVTNSNAGNGRALRA